MKGLPVVILVALLLAAAGCKTGPERAPAIGEAFAGPAVLSLRQDVNPQSKVIATVKHGERLEILQRRRRFIKVRTAQFAEGWTDDRLLLSPEELASLRKLNQQSKTAPSQGVASTYETLNVHTEPDRQSPSFLQVKEGEKVDVIGRRVSPRTSAAAPKPPPPPPPKPRSKKQSSKESKKSKQIPPPPMPEPPKLPRDWQQLSKLGTGQAVPAPSQEAQPVPMDDWSLIRNAAGQSGWVLTRRLMMAIPDEVAQYAEGRRISSYFPLGETRDGQLVKQSWLWTTVERGLEPHDFDSFRVFIWSLRRHRYETAHIERNLRGFFPVLTHPVAAPQVRGKESREKVPGFSILVEKKDGLRYRRSYAFLGNIVRFSSEERVDAPATQRIAEAGPSPEAETEEAPLSEKSLYSRTKQRLSDWRKRIFGR